ncbi:MAG: thermonuclease family protein [Pseudomonadota bacterium]
MTVLRSANYYLLAGLIFVLPAHAHQVIGIADGDTLTLLVDQKPVKIRLANIDAPEKKQPFGQRSKESLSNLCWGKNAEYVTQSIDRYKRVVALVYCDGAEVNKAQVAAGMAWTYPKYNKDAALPAMEQDARLTGLGLWADVAPVPPWEWRNTKR